MVPNSVVLNVAVLPLREPEAVNLRARLRPGMTPERPAGAAGEAAADAAARRAADHARGARRGGGRRAHLRDARASRPKGVSWPASCLSVVSRETRSARRGAHAVAQEQVESLSSTRQQLELGRRLELARRRGSAAPRPSPPRRPRASARATGTARRRVRRASSCAFRCGPPSHSSVRTREALAQLRAAPPAGRAPVALGAHVVDLGAGLAAGSPARR